MNAQRIRSVIGWLIVLAVVALAWPVQLGGHLGLTIVTGHSMEPTFHTGDVVVTWRTSDYARGQAVVYKIPADEPGAGHRVVHRITRGNGTEGFATQGDNNPTADIWTPKTSDVQGEVVTAVPRVGNVILSHHNPLLPALAVGILVTLALWCRVGEKERAAEAEARVAGARSLQAAGSSASGDRDVTMAA